MSTFKNEAGKPVLMRMVKGIQENKAYLGEVDGLIGDGDHGMNMNKGFSVFEERFKDEDFSFAEGLDELGMILLNEIGGSMGPIYGTIFMDMAEAGEDLDEISPADFGAMLEAGDELTEGSVNPHDILKIKGVRAVQDYMLQEVQRVYRLQGVEINDKHIEVIVRQMLKKIRIEEAGDTEFLPGTNVDILEFEDVNKALEEEGKEPATGEQIMLGITKASLATNSFLSAASFQETTKVLTEAAIKGKIDPLVGLKENVIIGKHIPAGTGMNKYRDIHLDSNAVKVEESEASDEMEEETVKQAGTLELVDEIETEEVLVEE